MRHILRSNLLIGSFLIGGVLGVLVGCGGQRSDDPADESGNRLIQAVATVGMVADLVRHVGGDHVAVTQICGSGVDPHLYMPTRDDVQSIMQADVVFFCGLMLEGKMAGTLEKIGKKKPVAAVTDAIDRAELISGGAGDASADHADPHVWNDVSLWRRCIEAVRKQLTELRPEFEEEFTANAERYAANLQRLHRYGQAVTETIPESSRLLVTSHDAFSYFGRAYGLDVRGIQGVSTESEAGLQQINALVDLLIERDVQAVFIESSVSPKNVEALIEGAASKGHQVVTGGTLFSDAMGKAGEYTGTYVGMLDHNLTTVTEALGGSVPDGGFRNWEQADAADAATEVEVDFNTAAEEAP